MRTTKLTNFLNPLYSSGHVRNDEGRGEDACHTLVVTFSSESGVSSAKAMRITWDWA